MAAYTPRMRVFPRVKMVTLYDSHTMQEALWLCNGAQNRSKFLTFVARKVHRIVCETNGCSRGEMLSNRQTGKQTDPTTVTLAAHARRGLMTRQLVKDNTCYLRFVRARYRERNT